MSPQSDVPPLPVVGAREVRCPVERSEIGLILPHAGESDLGPAA